MRRWFQREPIPPEKRLSKEALLSLSIHVGFQFGASMSGIFLNLYLWRLTHSLAINGWFNVIVFLMTATAFAVGGKWTKKKDRLFTIRLGIGLLVLFYLAVILAQEQVAQFFYLFAFFQGTASGLYWIGYQTLMYDVCTEQNRMRYISINLIFFTIAGLVGPALAGFIIGINSGLSGYIITFGIALAVFLATVILSFQIKAYKTHHKTYYLKLMLPLFKKNKRLRKALYGYYIVGLLQGMNMLLPNILLYQVVPKENVIGYLGMLFSAISIGSSFMMARSAKEQKERIYITVAAAGTTVGALWMIADVSLWPVIFFMAMFALFNPLQGNSMTSYYYRLIGTLPLKGQLRTETVAFRESFLNAGRISSIVLLISFVHDISAGWIPIFIAAAAAVQFLQFFLFDRDWTNDLRQKNIRS